MKNIFFAFWYNWLIKATINALPELHENARLDKIEEDLLDLEIRLNFIANKIHDNRL